MSEVNRQKGVEVFVKPVDPVASGWHWSEYIEK